MVVSASCSKDEASDPEGTATLNMLDEKNGKTLLGNSDVYINAAYNFRTSSCSMVDLGRRSGVGAVGFPSLKQLSSEAAVEPGHGYFICRDNAVREFASGELALAITADYYKVYVKSPIERDGAKVGAAVQFVLAEPAKYGLPEFDSEIGWNIYAEREYLEILLSTSDFEWELEGDGSLFESVKKGNKLRIYMLNSNDVQFGAGYALYLRIRGSYTQVQVVVTG